MPIPSLSSVPRFSPLVGEIGKTLAGGERKPDRLELMVGHGERIVEEDHHPVTGEVLERPAVARDQRPECSVVLAEYLEQLFGRSRLREGGEPSQVREEARDVRAVSRQQLLAVLARDELCHLRRQESRELLALPLDG